MRSQMNMATITQRKTKGSKSENRIVCRADDKLYERVRVAAIRERLSIQDLVSQALREYLARPRNAEAVGQ